MSEYVSRQKTGYTIQEDTLWSWGNQGAYGYIGDNTIVHRSSPVLINSGGPVWRQLTNSLGINGGIKSDGSLWLWGNGNYLLQNDITHRSSPVQAILGGTNWKLVSAGGFSVVGIQNDGTLWTWGWNAKGNLGNGTITQTSSPVQTLAGGNDWKLAVAGSYVTAGIKTDGTLWLWGAGNYGQLGNDNSINVSSPVQTVAGGTDWKLVSTGGYVLGAIKTDGTLWCWGSNNIGDVGDGTVIHRSSPVQTLAGGTNWVDVSTGTGSYAIKSDGTLWAWGANSRGQLGVGDRTSRSSPTQVLGAPNNWTKVLSAAVSASQYAMGLKSDGSLWTWGHNHTGQLGTGDRTHRSSPVQTMAGGTSWVLVPTNVTGATQSFAMRTDKRDLADKGLVTREYIIDVYPSLASTFKQAGLWGWGNGDAGSLGTGINNDYYSSPVQTIAGGSNWKYLSAARTTINGSTAAIKSDGTLWLWGYNNYGQLGDNTVTHRSSPVQTIAGGTDWKLTSINSGTCAAIKTDGTLWLWGTNSNGKLGNNNNAITSVSSPVQEVTGGTNWKLVAIGQYHAGGVKTDGSLWLWGGNANGQLGDSTLVDKSSPVQTVADTTVAWKTVSAGTYHTAAVKMDGSLWTWGSNGFGELGTQNTTNYSSPVQTIAGGTNWSKVEATYNATAAIKTDGTLWMWGWGDSGILGQGDGLETNYSSPIQTIARGNDWKLVSFGLYHVAALKIDGSLWTWGQNLAGQLGTGNITQYFSPVQTISGGRNWKLVSCGGYKTITIRDDSADPL